MSEQQGRAFLEALLDLLVQRLLRQVRNQHRDEVGVLSRCSRLGNSQSVALGLLPAGAALAHADDDVEPTILQIQRVRAALAAIAEYRNARAFQGLFVDVFPRIQPHQSLPVACGLN